MRQWLSFEDDSCDEETAVARKVPDDTITRSILTRFDPYEGHYIHCDFVTQLHEAAGALHQTAVYPVWSELIETCMRNISRNLRFIVEILGSVCSVTDDSEIRAHNVWWTLENWTLKKDFCATQLTWCIEYGSFTSVVSRTY